MRRIFFSIIILIVCLIIYGMYFNIYGLNSNEYIIESNTIGDKFRELKFIHFSDVLYGSTTNQSSLDNLVKEINKKNPDVVFFTGDLLYKDHKLTTEEKELIIKSLKSINACLYKYAVIGDNDKKYLDDYKDILNKSNFILLDNNNSLLFYKEIMPINIIGIDNKNKIDDLLKPEVEVNYNIVLTHKPDIYDDLQNRNIDLVLSGHTLNGQVRIPFVGGLLSQNGGKKYLDNHYIEKNTEMYVSNGLGVNKYKIRLFNRPSFNVYRITKK